MANQLGKDLGTGRLGAPPPGAGEKFSGTNDGDLQSAQVYVKPTDNVVFVNADDTTIAVILPEASASRFQVVTIKWANTPDDSGQVDITAGVDGTGLIEDQFGEVVDTGITLGEAQEYITLVSDGEIWWNIGTNAAGSVSNTALAPMAANTIKGNATAFETSPQNLTGTQAGKIISGDSLNSETVPATTLTVTTAGDTDGDYSFDFELNIAQANTQVSFEPNGGTSNLKSFSAEWTVGVGRRTDWKLANNAGPINFDVGDKIYGRAYLRAKSGRVRYFELIAYADIATDDRLVICGVWTDTATNLTSFVVRASVASGFGAASFLRVMKIPTTN